MQEKNQVSENMVQTKVEGPRMSADRLRRQFVRYETLRKQGFRRLRIR